MKSLLATAALCASFLFPSVAKAQDTNIKKITAGVGINQVTSVPGEPFSVFFGNVSYMNSGPQLGHYAEVEWAPPQSIGSLERDYAFSKESLSRVNGPSVYSKAIFRAGVVLPTRGPLYVGLGMGIEQQLQDLHVISSDNPSLVGNDVSFEPGGSHIKGNVKIGVDIPTLLKNAYFELQLNTDINLEPEQSRGAFGYSVTAGFSFRP